MKFISSFLKCRNHIKHETLRGQSILHVDKMLRPSKTSNIRRVFKTFSAIHLPRTDFIYSVVGNVRNTSHEEGLRAVKPVK